MASPPAQHDSRLPMPGAVITRKYKGTTLEVKVLADGFQYEGRCYKSLSAVAKVITGTHANGFHFFRLSKEQIAMKRNLAAPRVRCAIYTRKSTEEGLEQEFNSLDAQRESAEAYIKSQAHEGWALPGRTLRRRRLHRRQHGPAGAGAAVGRHRARARSIASSSTRSTGSAAACSISPG